MSEFVTVKKSTLEKLVEPGRESSVTDAEWSELRAVLAREAGHVEEQVGMVEAAAYRYKEGRAAWESEKPWEPTTLAHGAVLLERKALSAAGTFKGDSQAYYLALTVEPLYTSPPAPVAVPDGWKLVPIEPTEAMLNVLHDRVLISVNSRKQEASILNDKAWWKAVVDSAPTCLDKVKEMNQ